MRRRSATHPKRRNPAGQRALGSIALLPLLAGSAGCGAAGAADELRFEDTPVLETREVLRIGSVSDPELGFSAIGPVAVDDDGNIYVVEAQDLEVRVFSPAGERIGTIGRRGQGPGEFTGFLAVSVAGDTVWVQDRGRPRRISLFLRDGTLLKTSGTINGIRVPVRPTTDGIIYPTEIRPDRTFDSDMTTLTGHLESSGPAPGENDTIRVPRVRFNADGAVVDTIGYDMRPPSPPSTPTERTEILGKQYNIPRPPSDAPLSFPVADGRVHISRAAPPAEGPATFTVTRLNFAFDTVYHTAITYQPRPYSDAALDSIAWWGVRIPGGSYRLVNGQPVYPDLPDNPDEVRRQLRATMSFPPFPPPVRYHRVGSDGAIWLLREDTGADEGEYIVLNEDGTVRGRVLLPRAAVILWSSGDEVITREADDLDVPWLVKYRIAGAP